MRNDLFFSDTISVCTKIPNSSARPAGGRRAGRRWRRGVEVLMNRSLMFGAVDRGREVIVQKTRQMARKEVMSNVSADKNSEQGRHRGLHLRLLRVRMRFVVPSFLFLRRETGMPGELPGPVEEGTGRS